MRLHFAVLLSLISFSFVLINHVLGANLASSGLPDSYTTHIGSRVPPVEAGCLQIDVVMTDEGKSLNVFACPSNFSG